VFLNEVSDQYFMTLGTRLLAGRDFNGHDAAGSPRVSVANESFAKKYLRGQSPVGQSYRARQGDKWGDAVEIVGLVRDAKYLDLRETFHPTIYVPASQNLEPGKIATFELRAAGNPTTLVQAAKRAVDAVDPDASLQFKTLSEQFDESLARERLLASLSGFFSCLALLLAMIGLYGVTSYSVTRRRNEIGIRMALGAQRSQVLRTVLGELMVLVGIGLVIGLAATISVSHLITSLLFGIRGNDPLTLSLTAALLASVAGIAGFLPARRASRLDPINVLREE
jgi:putative ABC transport system permease protein